MHPQSDTLRDVNEIDQHAHARSFAHRPALQETLRNHLAQIRAIIPPSVRELGFTSSSQGKVSNVSGKRLRHFGRGEVATARDLRPRQSKSYLLNVLANLSVDKLKQFESRLVLTGNTNTPRENDFDYLKQTAAVFET